jgi:hypothetical protein
MPGMRRGEYTLALCGSELQCIQAGVGDGPCGISRAARTRRWRAVSACVAGRPRVRSAVDAPEAWMQSSRPKYNPDGDLVGGVQVWLGQEQSIARSRLALSLRRHRCSVLAPQPPDVRVWPAAHAACTRASACYLPHAHAPNPLGGSSPQRSGRASAVRCAHAHTWSASLLTWVCVGCALAGHSRLRSS